MASRSTDVLDDRAQTPAATTPPEAKRNREVVVRLRVRTLALSGGIAAILLVAAGVLLALQLWPDDPMPAAPGPWNLPSPQAPPGPAAEPVARPGPAPAELRNDAGAPFPVMDVALQMFAGKPVSGVAVPVQAVLSDRGFWAGSSEADRVLVRVDEPSVRPVPVKVGDKVTVQGVLLGIPEDAQARFGVTGPALEQLRATGVYLHVTAISAA